MSRQTRSAMAVFGLDQRHRGADGDRGEIARTNSHWAAADQSGQRWLHQRQRCLVDPKCRFTIGANSLGAVISGISSPIAQAGTAAITASRGRPARGARRHQRGDTVRRSRPRILCRSGHRRSSSIARPARRGCRRLAGRSAASICRRLAASADHRRRPRRCPVRRGAEDGDGERLPETEEERPLRAKELAHRPVASIEQPQSSIYSASEVPRTCRSCRESTTALVRD